MFRHAPYDVQLNLMSRQKEPPSTPLSTETVLDPHTTPTPDSLGIPLKTSIQEAVITPVEDRVS